MGLRRGGVIFADVGLFPGLCGFVLAVPQKNIQDVVGVVTLSQPTEGKDLPKKNPTTIKTQGHIENQHK